MADQGGLDDGTELVDPQVFRQRVDGDDATVHRGGAVEGLHARAGHLPVFAVAAVVTEPLRLAAEGKALAHAEAGGSVRLVEPDALEAVPAIVGQDDTDDAAALEQLAALDLDDLSLHGEQVALGQ